MFAKRMRPFLFGALFLMVFGAGYYLGSRSDHIIPTSEVSARQAVQTLWVQTAEPPVPEVWIEGNQIDVRRSGYSWCNGYQCVMTDAAIPTLDTITHVIVSGGADIETKPPIGIKSFQVRNLTLSGHEYTVPAEPGSYLYEISCTWFLDQGNANFYFAVKVE